MDYRSAYTAAWAADSNVPRRRIMTETPPPRPSMYQSLQTSITSRIPRLSFSQNTPIPPRPAARRGLLATSSSSNDRPDVSSAEPSRPSTPATEVEEQEALQLVRQDEAGIDWNLTKAASVVSRIAIDRSITSPREAQDMQHDALKLMIRAASTTMTAEQWQAIKDIQPETLQRPPASGRLSWFVSKVLMCFVAAVILLGPWFLAGLEKLVHWEKRTHFCREAGRKVADMARADSLSWFGILFAGVVYLLDEVSMGTANAYHEIEKRRRI